ncbi:unnamed protein product [Symbiodinium sp. CCMP2592]|nr:unnamed protein product [Symbiodinium sp. CCMP2592]
MAAKACTGVVGRDVQDAGVGGGGPAGLLLAHPTLPRGLLTGTGGGGPAGALVIAAGGAVASSPELGGLGGLSDEEDSGATVALALGLPDRDLDGLPLRASLGDILG